MLRPGEIVLLDLGLPAGSEAGLIRPAVVLTAGRVLRGEPNVIQVIPLTRSVRNSAVEVLIEPDEFNGLEALSSAQCQHLRAVATNRINARVGNVGSAVLLQLRAAVADLLDI